MTTRKRIILAVANGCTNVRQIAKWLNMPHSTISNYFYKNISPLRRFTNGYLLKWAGKRKANTILPHRVAVLRVKGQVEELWAVADMGDLEASFKRDI